MTKSNTDEATKDETIKAKVSSELEEAKEFAKSLNIDEVKSGQWFIALLHKVIQAYNHNARAEYFQNKYPGLPPDDIADTLTSITVKYATIAGGITGAAATTSQIAALSSVGMTIPIMLGAIGAEMICLAHIQMKLVLDLSVIYDLQLDPDDPEDILMIFGYALGVAPTEILGKGLQVAARSGTQNAIKKYISKGTLKAVQAFAKKIGFKILQRTIIKYAVPVASTVVGSSYNYVTTKSIGKVAKSHLRNRGKVTDELRVLVSRQNTYNVAFPAAVMYMAQIDGQLTVKKKELYRALLSRISLEEYSQDKFQKIVASEKNILEAIVKIDDSEMRESLLEVLILMVIYDGNLTEKEQGFLVKVAEHLNIPMDIDEVQKRAKGYHLNMKKNVFQKTIGSAKETSSKATEIAGQTANNVKDAASTASSKITSAFGKTFQRKKKEGEIVESKESSSICTGCENKVPTKYNFCPHCGQSMATEKNCVSCNEILPIDFPFCPHCGSSQNN